MFFSKPFQPCPFKSKPGLKNPKIHSRHSLLTAHRVHPRKSAVEPFPITAITGSPDHPISSSPGSPPLALHTASPPTEYSDSSAATPLCAPNRACSARGNLRCRDGLPASLPDRLP